MTDVVAKRSRARLFVWGALALLLVVALVRAFRPSPVIVDAAAVHRGPLRVSVDDDGRTRVRERFTISAPIAGRLLRTLLDPGDTVRAGDTVIAEFEPAAPDPLDVRARREAEARLSRAAAALEEAEARKAQAAAEHRFAETDLARVSKLTAQGVQPREDLDRARRDEATAAEAERAAARAVDAARYALEEARATLLDAPDSAGERPLPPPQRSAEETESVPSADLVHPYVEPSGGRLLLRAPIDGHVLRVFEESARTLAAGTPILEVGDTRNLEIVADYLSEEAVKVKPGMMVVVGGWGGDRVGHSEELHASVRLVEPAGFTKVSALGVEEQRVNIIMDPAGDAEAWAALGDGYRVELQIVLWEGHDVVVVPTGALFRQQNSWATFVVRDGRADLRTVEIAHMGGLEAEVVSGIEPGERVVMYPSELIADGTRVVTR